MNSDNFFEGSWNNLFEPPNRPSLLKSFIKVFCGQALTPTPPQKSGRGNYRKKGRAENTPLDLFPELINYHYSQDKMEIGLNLFECPKVSYRIPYGPSG